MKGKVTLEIAEDALAPDKQLIFKKGRILHITSSNIIRNNDLFPDKVTFYEMVVKVSTVNEINTNEVDVHIVKVDPSDWKRIIKESLVDNDITFNIVNGYAKMSNDKEADDGEKLIYIFHPESDEILVGKKKMLDCGYLDELFDAVTCDEEELLELAEQTRGSIRDLTWIIDAIKEKKITVSYKPLVENEQRAQG